MILHATRGAERGTEQDSDASGMRENALVNRSWHRTRVRRCKTAAEMPKPESERSVNLPAAVPSTGTGMRAGWYAHGTEVETALDFACAA